jgi:hypothetical protein
MAATLAWKSAVRALSCVSRTGMQVFLFEEAHRLNRLNRLNGLNRLETPD